MDDTFNAPVGGYDDEGCDFFFFHEGKGRGCEGAAFDGERMCVHDVAGGVFEGVGAIAFEETAEIAVGDHADEMVVCDDGRHAEFLSRHLIDHLGHGSGRRDLRYRVGGVHELADACEALADAATGVQVGEVFRLPATTAAYFEGECVAESEHDGCGGGGCEVEGAGFGGDTGVEEDAARLGEGGGAAAADGDQGGVEPLEGGEEAQELFGLSAVGEYEDDVAG
jgi:hypothetical protein